MIQIDIQKRLGSEVQDIFLDINIEFAEEEFVVLYGKSGVGKTSILRMIAGLLKPDSGTIEIKNEKWFSSKGKINLKPQSRKVGMVFQDFALFPNMTVLENLKFALPKKSSSEIIEELVSLMEIKPFLNNYPNTLSGGQKQRVALARALVQKPEILLLDEPLSALDHEMRRKLQNYLQEIHRKYKLTTILVSHDVSEIVRLATKVFTLENGKVVKSGKPIEIFSNTKLSGKFQFVGEILEVQKQSFILIYTILVGNEIVKVFSENSEENIQVGDKVIVATKAFHPLIKKIG
ncbi:ABC transporter ATP-binding protein [Aureivirga sp. CE67]|uniref:ATP-binding cassette domain-containing protein n=1 Tax=Aureivirga sp. CE67 TaxID=1788983 RepID=UPI0018C8E3E0|nr:ABC transporter ATP-binding protein [Aureivirga sp. CE67]